VESYVGTPTQHVGKSTSPISKAYKQVECVLVKKGMLAKRRRHIEKKIKNE